VVSASPSTAQGLIVAAETQEGLDPCHVRLSSSAPFAPNRARCSSSMASAVRILSCRSLWIAPASIAIPAPAPMTGRQRWGRFSDTFVATDSCVARERPGRRVGLLGAHDDEARALIVTLTGSGLFTVMVMEFEVAGLPMTQGRSEVVCMDESPLAGA